MSKIKLNCWGMFFFLSSAISVPSAAFAHHSFAMFDPKKEITLEGTVVDFQWTNPHAWIELSVNENGTQVKYSLECSSPNVMARRGWSRKALSPGDKVKIVMRPLRDGDRGGQMLRVIFSDGRSMENT